MSRRYRLGILLAATAFFAPLILTSCSALAQSPPRVTIDSGELEGQRDGDVQVFRGIPYAAPPVGELRWRAPQPAKKWSGIRKAHDYGNDAPQKNGLAPHQDEDCLFVNVWAPADAKERPYPVMVWIHGGGFIQGSGRINGEAFAKRGVVLVSFNYRLGRLGAFGHPALLKQLPNGEPPANFWLQDQVAALQWVQRNIAPFGGDPSRVTIFGVSAGGTSVNILMASPLAKGLFHRAIAQSGIGGFGPYRRLQDEHRGREPLTLLGERYAKSQGLENKPDVATALRALPWRTVAKTGSDEDGGGFDVVVDGVSLQDDPQLIFEQGRQNRVPFIAGCNSFEGNLSLVLPWTDQPPKAEVQARLDRLAPLYGRKPDDSALWADLYGDVYFRASTLHLIRQMQKVETPAWNYHFDYVRQSGRKGSRGAGHGSEVAYVFDSLILPADGDREISRAMQGHWIQFAKTGNPNGSGLPEWPSYTSAAPTTLIYGQEGIKAERDLHKPRFDLLFEAFEQAWPSLDAKRAVVTERATPTTTKPTGSSKTDEQALRERVAGLFEAMRAGDIDKCLNMSDPTAIQKHGRDKSEKFFKGLSGLIKLSRVSTNDHRVSSVTIADDGKTARVQTEVRLRGKWQPPSTEVWTLIDDKWHYQETLPK